MKKISIVLTSYNRIEYLKRALASVLGQGHPSLEVVITDDCSTDGSWEWIKKQTNKPNVIGVRQVKNFGFPTRPRICGVYFSTGEIIGFLDEDNEFMPGKVVSMASLFWPGVDVVYCWSQGIQEGKYVTVPWITQPEEFSPSLLEQNNYIDLSEPMILRSTIEKIGCFDEKLSWNEEWDLWRRMVNAGTGFKCVPQMWNLYSVHRADSRSGRMDIRRAANDRIEVKRRSPQRYSLKVDAGGRQMSMSTIGQFTEQFSEKYQVAVCRDGSEETVDVSTVAEK